MVHDTKQVELSLSLSICRLLSNMCSPRNDGQGPGGSPGAWHVGRGREHPESNAPSISCFSVGRVTDFPEAPAVHLTEMPTVKEKRVQRKGGPRSVWYQPGDHLTCAFTT